MKLLLKYKLAIAGMLLGGVAGYVYYALVGCSSGSCAITSSPVNSTLYGAVMGGLLLDLLRKNKSEKTEKNES